MLFSAPVIVDLVHVILDLIMHRLLLVIEPIKLALHDARVVLY